MAVWHKIGSWWYRTILKHQNKKIEKQSAVIESFKGTKEDECSKPFNNTIILGCDKVSYKGPIPPKEFSSWEEFTKAMEE